LNITSANARRCFISYRRHNSGDVRALTRALRHRGITTWLDTENLANEQTEDEIRRVIHSDETGGAILYLTPATCGSPMILDVEIPQLLARKRLDSSFFIVPVLGPGINYDEMGRLLGYRFGADDLARWNVMRPSGTGTFLRDHAREVAKRVVALTLEQRLTGKPRDVTYRLRLDARRRPGFDPSALLSLDWSDRFPVHLVGEGLLGMPAAIALGRAFASPKQVRLDWAQSRTDSDTEIWSLSRVDEEIACSASMESRDTASQELALLVSITDDVRPSFDLSSLVSAPVRALIDVRLQAFSHRLSSAQAGHVVRKTIAALRAARSRYRAMGTVHVFIAGPVGIGVLLGEELNTFSSITTYEFCPAERVPYIAAAVLY